MFSAEVPFKYGEPVDGFKQGPIKLNETQQKRIQEYNSQFSNMAVTPPTLMRMRITTTSDKYVTLFQIFCRLNN